MIQEAGSFVPGGGKGFLVAVHPCANRRVTETIRRFVGEEAIDAVLFFGDVTGPILTDGQRVLYDQARELFADAHSIPERVKVARQFLAGSGLARMYRDAVRFYLSQIADEADGRSSGARFTSGPASA